MRSKFDCAWKYQSKEILHYCSFIWKEILKNEEENTGEKNLKVIKNHKEINTRHIEISKKVRIIWIYWKLSTIPEILMKHEMKEVIRIKSNIRVRGYIKEEWTFADILKCCVIAWKFWEVLQISFYTVGDWSWYIEIIWRCMKILKAGH